MQPDDYCVGWSKFLETAAQSLSGHVLETWFRPLRCLSLHDGVATLEVRDKFARDWLHDHYIDFIRDGLSVQFGQTVAIEWHVNPDQKAIHAAPLPDEVSTDAPAPNVPVDTSELYRRPLNRRYHFDSFIKGPSNQLAEAAARAVAEKPGERYNPLFLYGHVGLGKTHLLCAIGHEALRNNPSCRVIYTSSERFMNEVVHAVLGGKLEQLHTKYRNNCDVLLIDDIQLIAGKERTQHEFFHIFNTLYDSERQIVVTSDKLPHEIPDIDERLRNRFQFGLIADIQPPEVETRVAIVHRKSLEEGVTLPDDVAFFLAENIRSNIRELEGALVRLLAHTSLTGTALSLEYAQQVLADVMACRRQQLSVESIQKTVAEYFSLRVTDLKSHRRHKKLVRPRQVAMYLARKYAGASYPDLGSRFGDKDHTTVMSACKKVKSLLKTDASLRGQLHELERHLNMGS